MFVAAVYDTFMVPGDKLGFEQVRKSVAKKATGRVLEIGAGTGLNFRFFDNASCIFAIEPDKFMLKRAIKRIRNCAALVQAEAEQIPFPDNSFDTVISTLTFCTIRNPLRAVAEIRRVLRSYGRFYFAEHPIAEHRIIAKAEKVLTPVWKKLAAGCHLDRDIVSYFEDGGLELVEIDRLDSFFVAGQAKKSSIIAEGVHR